RVSSATDLSRVSHKSLSAGEEDSSRSGCRRVLRPFGTQEAQEARECNAAKAVCTADAAQTTHRYAHASRLRRHQYHGPDFEVQCATKSASISKRTHSGTSCGLRNHKLTP